MWDIYLIIPIIEFMPVVYSIRYTQKSVVSNKVTPSQIIQKY